MFKFEKQHCHTIHDPGASDRAVNSSARFLSGSWWRTPWKRALWTSRSGSACSPMGPSGTRTPATASSAWGSRRCASCSASDPSRPSVCTHHAVHSGFCGPSPRCLDFSIESCSVPPRGAGHLPAGQGDILIALSHTRVVKSTPIGQMPPAICVISCKSHNKAETLITGSSFFLRGMAFAQLIARAVPEFASHIARLLFPHFFL